MIKNKICIHHKYLLEISSFLIFNHNNANIIRIINQNECEIIKDYTDCHLNKKNQFL